MLIDGLKALLPAAGFYGEETGKQGDSELRWVVDPLDGTTNFLSGLDQFCISVALEKTQQTQLGVVWHMLPQVYYKDSGKPISNPTMSQQQSCFLKRLDA